MLRVLAAFFLGALTAALGLVVVSYYGVDWLATHISAKDWEAGGLTPGGLQVILGIYSFATAAYVSTRIDKYSDTFYGYVWSIAGYPFFALYSWSWWMLIFIALQFIVPVGAATFAFEPALSVRNEPDIGEAIAELGSIAIETKHTIWRLFE